MMTERVSAAAYQSWLRYRIATLEEQQADRVERVARLKADLDRTLEANQREIDNLKTQQTIVATSKHS